MTKQCPNCNKEFIEQREGVFRCEDCGWFKEVDGKWYNCPEPPIVKEPDPKLNVPAPPEPVLKEPDKLKGKVTTNQDRLDPKCRSYLGGLVTVTETEDEDEKND